VNKGSETYFHLAQPYPVIDLSDVAASSPGLTGTVVDVSWSQLEPSPGTFDFSTLDADLAVVSAYNSAHPGATLGVKLRVWAANDAPEWAKTMDGAVRTWASPVTLRPRSRVGVEIFSSPPHQRAPPSCKLSRRPNQVDGNSIWDDTIASHPELFD